MEVGNFEFILNNHFIIRHCTARDGYDTPTDFRCIKGLRKWSRFFYLDKGVIDFTCESGEKLRIESGDIIFLPYDVEYSSSWIDDQDGYYFSVEFILEYPDGSNLNLYDDITYLFRDNGTFKNYFREMKDTIYGGSLGFQLKCQEQLVHLFYNLAIRIKGNNSALQDIRPALAVIEGNFSDEINVSALAKKCHMSPATLRRRFAKHFSMSPVKYCNKLRLEKARVLIETGTYKISEVSSMVGFDDIHYFSKIYKKHFGKSPSSDLPY